MSFTIDASRNKDGCKEIKDTRASLVDVSSGSFISHLGSSRSYLFIHFLMEVLCDESVWRSSNLHRRESEKEKICDEENQQTADG